MPDDDPDKGFEPWSDERVYAKAKEPGGIAWMERVGVISSEAAGELRKRFPEAA